MLRFLVVHLILVVVVDLVDLCLLLKDLRVLLSSDFFSSGELIAEHLDVLLMTVVDLTLSVVLRVKGTDLFIVDADFLKAACFVLHRHFLEELLPFAHR